MMGSLRAEGRFFATLSRHNSSKDTRHDELWLDFIDKIKQISSNPKYREINLDIQANTEDME
jgi:hypothetical protein